MILKMIFPVLKLNILVAYWLKKCAILKIYSIKVLNEIKELFKIFLSVQKENKNLNIYHISFVKKTIWYIVCKAIKSYKPAHSVKLDSLSFQNHGQN